VNLVCRGRSNVEDVSNDICTPRTFSASSPGIRAYPVMPSLLCQLSYTSTRVLLAYCIAEDSWILRKHNEPRKGADQSLKSPWIFVLSGWSARYSDWHRNESAGCTARRLVSSHYLFLQLKTSKSALLSQRGPQEKLDFPKTLPDVSRSSDPPRLDLFVLLTHIINSSHSHGSVTPALRPWSASKRC